MSVSAVLLILVTPLTVVIDIGAFTPWLPVLAILAAIVLALLVIIPSVNLGPLTAFLMWVGFVLLMGLAMWFYDYNRDNDLIDVRTNDNGAAQQVAQGVTTQEPAETTVEPAPATTEEPVDLDTTTDGQFPQCRDIQSPEDAERVLGGDSRYWAVPDWVSQTSQGAFKYLGSRVTFRYPGWGYFDTPGPKRVEGNVTGDDISFHCEDAPD